MKKLFTLTLILLTAYCTLHTAKPVLAQNVGLAISPPVVEVLLAPNKNIVQSFQLTNQGESTQFVANIHTITPTDSDGHSIIDPTPIDPTTIPLVITLANADRELGTPFTLSAHDSTQLVLSIEGASTDVSQDVYFALVITPTLNQNSSSTSIPGISSLILLTLTPDGALPIKLRVDGFDLPILHDSALPLPVPATITNSSDIMIRPTGTLIIYKTNQNISEEITISPNLVLAHSSRTITTLSESLIYRPTWYSFGPHQFELTIHSPGGSQITQVTKTVWLLPIRALITTILIAITTTTLLLSAKRRSGTNID